MLEYIIIELLLHVYFLSYFFVQLEQFFSGFKRTRLFHENEDTCLVIISPLKEEIRAFSSRDPTIARFFSPFHHIRLFLDPFRLCGRRSQFREGLLAFSLSRLCVRAVRRHRRCRRRRRHCRRGRR